MVPVDEVLPEILVGVIDSVSGLLDSSFSGTIYIEKASGPGELYGVLSMAGERWFNFNNLKLSEPGMYVLRFFTEDSALYKEAFVEVEVIQATNSSVVLVRDDDGQKQPNSIVEKIGETNSGGVVSFEFENLGLFNIEVEKEILETNSLICGRSNISLEENETKSITIQALEVNCN